MKKSGKIYLPTTKKFTKMPKRSWLSKRNHEILAKIERWKRKFG